MNPAWRTDTVLALCAGMREAQDFSALPILADALQDAGCDDADLLARLRAVPPSYAERAALAACVMSDECADAVAWLCAFADAHDCPAFGVLVAAAAGHHAENADPENDPSKYPNYFCSGNDGEFLHFGGRDAHGDIPAEFWDRVETATGKRIRPGRRASFFSCSC